MRRPQPTAESRARAARIAASLAGLLDEAPTAAAPTPTAPRVAGPLRCPGCGASMTISTRGHERIEVDLCEACGSIWLDVGELEALTRDLEAPAATNTPLPEIVAQVRAGLPAEEEVRYRECPRCRALMGRRNFGEVSGVIVDECPRHGVLLDAGELEAIETFIRLGGPARAAERRRSTPAPATTPTPTPPAVARELTLRERLAIDLVWDTLFGWL
ncbi:MAG: zf-TFIIB domain-containing protein [Nannocystaceae bacterium]